MTIGHIHYADSPIFQKEQKNQMEKYEFRGELNMDIVVNSAIEDNKRSFIIMKKNEAVVGILKNTKLKNFNRALSSTPYHLIPIPKSEIGDWIKTLKKERIDHEKFIKKQIRKIKKQTTKRNKENKKAERFQVFTF